jgi:hypothetical protein
MTDNSNGHYTALPQDTSRHRRLLPGRVFRLDRPRIRDVDVGFLLVLWAFHIANRLVDTLCRALATVVDALN